MDDIVERLRGTREAFPTLKVLDDAADEIETLRECLNLWRSGEFQSAINRQKRNP
jgi:hypothetical protein